MEVKLIFYSFIYFSLKLKHSKMYNFLRVDYFLFFSEFPSPVNGLKSSLCSFCNTTKIKIINLSPTTYKMK